MTRKITGNDLSTDLAAVIACGGMAFVAFIIILAQVALDESTQKWQNPCEAGLMNYTVEQNIFWSKDYVVNLDEKYFEPAVATHGILNCTLYQLAGNESGLWSCLMYDEDKICPSTVEVLVKA